MTKQSEISLNDEQEKRCSKLSSHTSNILIEELRKILKEEGIYDDISGALFVAQYIGALATNVIANVCLSTVQMAIAVNVINNASEPSIKHFISRSGFYNDPAGAMASFETALSDLQKNAILNVNFQEEKL